MSFLTSQPDLSGTIYENQSLREPREYLVSLIKEVDPEWLNAPLGMLGNYWGRDDTTATCYLIWFAYMVNTIHCYTMPQSHLKLKAKIKGLLHAHSEKQFTENLLELEVAWALLQRVSPLLFEPLVSEEEFADSSKLPKSPDFSFDLPEGRVYVEATICYVDILEKWQQAVDYIMMTLEKRLLKKGQTLKLQLRLPLRKYNQEQIAKMTNYAWKKIDLSPSGQLTLLERGILQWSPYHITNVQNNTSSSCITYSKIDQPSLAASATGDWEILFRAQLLTENPSGFIDFSPSGIFHTSDWSVDQAVVKEPYLIALSEKDLRAADEFILTSFLSKLKKKRDQAPRGQPYLLVVKPGHYRLVNEGLAKMIEEQIWTKEDYNWITGIILYTSRQGFSQRNASGNLLISLNPFARCPAGASLDSVINGTAQFHSDWHI